MPIDMKALARLGAQARIVALGAEIDALLRVFPDLGKPPARAASKPAEARSGGRMKRNKMSEATRIKLKASWVKGKAASVKPGGAEQTIVDAEPATAQVAKKRTMSVEARARISAAQKKRWAARKKGTKKKE